MMMLEEEEGMLERVLVFMASAGTQNAQYYLSEKPAVEDRVSSNLSPAALIQLQARHHATPPPTRIVALVTEQAKEHQSAIAEAFVVDGQPLPIDWIAIPDGENAEQLMEIVHKLLDVIPHRCRLVVDITHGFRPGPFVFSVAIQYLALLNPYVELEGLYYGMFRKDGPTAIIDMKVFLDMLDWLYGARVFRDTFIPNQLVKKIEAVAGEVGLHPEGVPLIGALRLFATATDAALPNEMAIGASALREALAEEVPRPLRERIPVADRLFNAVTEVANEFVPVSDVQPGRLPDGESDRQALVIDKLLDHGRTVQAVGLMREWCYLQVQRHNADQMGGVGVRQWMRGKTLADERVRTWFRDTLELRNGLHHYGTLDGGAIELDGLTARVNELWMNLKETSRQPRRWRVNKEPRRNAPLTSTPMAGFLRKWPGNDDAER